MRFIVSTVVKIDNILARGEEWALISLVAVMSGVVFLQVIYRYLLAQPLHWSEELARYLFVWISLLGAALSLRKKGHFGMDYLFRRLSGGYRRGLAFFICGVMGIVILVLLFNGILLVQKTADQQSPAMQISMGWAYACVPAGAALMLIHLLSIVLRENIGEDSER